LDVSQLPNGSFLASSSKREAGFVRRHAVCRGSYGKSVQYMMIAIKCITAGSRFLVLTACQLAKGFALDIPHLSARTK
jgi:hypothetical protein